MKSFSFLIFGFLFFTLIKSGLTKPSPASDEDYPGDDDYPNAYDDDESKQTSVESTKATLPHAHLTKVEDYQQAVEGTNVRLQCVKHINNFNAGSNLIMWYKGATLLYQSSVRISQDPRYKLDNLDLVIQNVRPEDASKYLCKLIPEKDILTINLDVTKAPMVKILDNFRDVSDNTITYKEGQRVEFECKADEDTIITWSFKGGRLVGSKQGVRVENGKLMINKVEHHHAGTYQCLVVKGNEAPAHQSVYLNVEFSPKVTTHHKIVNSGAGYDADLRCVFLSNPQGTAVWKKNGTRVYGNQKYVYSYDSHNNHNRTTLTVKSVEKNDLTDYECEVTNKFGSESTRLDLVYVPEPPHFDKYEINNGHVLVNWTIRSIQPLTEVSVYYKSKDSTTWVVEKPLVGENHQPHTGLYKIQHKAKLEDGTWHVKAKSINSEGVSAYSEDHVIEVDTSSFEDADNVEEIDEDLVAKGSIHKASSASAISANILCLTTLFTVVLRLI